MSEDDLTAANEALTRRVEQLEAMVASLVAEGSQTSSSGSDTTTSRRGLLRGGALAVGAGIASVAATASPAGAANGGNMIIGNQNIASRGTLLSAGDAAGQLDQENVFTAADVAGGSFYPSAIGGFATGQHVRNGVYAFSGNRDDNDPGSGHAVIALGTSSARSNLWLVPSHTPPATHGFAHSAGELIAADDGSLWYCTEAGIPGTWVELAVVQNAGPTFLDPPQRAFDSRGGKFPNTTAAGAKGRMKAGETRLIDLNGSSSLPVEARYVIVNVTVANTGGSGFLTLFNADRERPAASTLNWFNPESQLANTTVVACNATQQVRIHTSSAANVIVDILGWYPAQRDPQPGAG